MMGICLTIKSVPEIDEANENMIINAHNVKCTRTKLGLYKMQMQKSYWEAIHFLSIFSQAEGRNDAEHNEQRCQLPFPGKQYDGVTG